MINFNEQLTQADAKWILEEVVPKANYRIDHTTLAWWRDAHNKAFKEQVGIPGCGCEFKATHQVWTSRLSQYQAQIEAKAYPPVEFAPSEIVSEAVIEMQTLPNEIRVKTRKSRK